MKFYLRLIASLVILAVGILGLNFGLSLVNLPSTTLVFVGIMVTITSLLLTFSGLKLVIFGK